VKIIQQIWIEFKLRSELGQIKNSWDVVYWVGAPKHDWQNGN
jgi:hypothetical protein